MAHRGTLEGPCVLGFWMNSKINNTCGETNNLPLHMLTTLLSLDLCSVVERFSYLTTLVDRVFFWCVVNRGFGTCALSCMCQHNRLIHHCLLALVDALIRFITFILVHCFNGRVTQKHRQEYLHT